MQVDEVNPLLDGKSYVEVAIEYEKSADRLSQELGTIILAGSGVRVNVRNGALNLHQGKTHVPQEVTDTTLWAGTHSIKKLVIFSEDGYITLDAIHWCRNQGIDIVMLDDYGELVSVAGEFKIDVELRRCQYQATDTGMAGYIARELIRRKIRVQMKTLVKLFPGHKVKPALDALEERMADLDHVNTITEIQTIEANCAAQYWMCFKGEPIYWRPHDGKIVPPHWKEIGERINSLSGTTARHAINPFQSVLNYAILESQVLVAINASGLDPAVGCLHQDRLGRNSLVFDFMEPHRPQVDRMVFNLFTKTIFTRGMFILQETGEVRLNKQFARYIAVSCSLPIKTISDMVTYFVIMYRRV